MYKIEDYLKLREAYFRLSAFEATNKTEEINLRALLNSHYHNFVKQHGNLNDSTNAKVIMMDASGLELLSLEIADGGGKLTKADIFQYPVAFNKNEIAEVDNATEALSTSLNKYGKVDIGYITSLVNGGNEEDILRELHSKIYYNPLESVYEAKEKFIAGNVIEKYEKVENWLKNNPSNPAIETAFSALKESIPLQITFEELEFNFGERWIPTPVFERFAEHLFQTPINIHYSETSDEFSFKSERNNLLISEKLAVRAERRTFNGLALMKHAFHNTSPDITKSGYNKEGDPIRMRDNERIQLANSKIDEIRDSFTDWLNMQTQEFKQRLTMLYNDTFNCFVRPDYDGSHLKLSDMNLRALGYDEIYKSQKDCAWMLIQNSGSIVDHEVGAGKTMIMCIAAHEMKRLGTTNKPMIIGMKANIAEIAKTFKTAYPTAKILFPTAKDYEPKNRKAFFHKIKNNSWDAVIMSHDQFKMIPQSLNVQQEILQQELESVEENLRVLELQGKDISRGMLRGVKKRQINLEVKLATIAHQIAKQRDDVADFDTMGIDHIFVDESHQFKNLMFNTRHDRVAGLGNSAGSQKALNLLFAIRTIQKRSGKDLGATFLSGTTISNSLTELYCLFKYLRPQALEQQGIRCFDAWAAIYAKKSIDYEFTVTNEIKQKERFRYFIKVPELAAFYNEITDYRTAEEIGIDRPEKSVIFHDIEPTAQQEDFIKRLVYFARTGDGEAIGRDKLTEAEMTAKMLLATNYSMKMSLDMRLIDQNNGDHPNNKLSHCARNIAERYYKFNEQKATQFVFSDLGTYKPAQWNVYSELKRKLVEEYGIPAHEIAFTQEMKSEKIRNAMIKSTNEGTIRVLMGSTQQLGTGVNAQQRGVAIHHLDTPWRPSDVEQRDGRLIRTGNEVAKQFADNKVDVIIYAVKKTLDAYKFNLLHCKELYIKQLKNNNLATRKIDEGAMSEDGGMNFAEYVAILSGNTELLEKARLDKKITALESERQSFLRNRISSEYLLKEYRLTLENDTSFISRLERDLSDFTSRAMKDNEGNIVNSIQIDGVQGSDPKAVGAKLNELANSMRTNNEHFKVGALYGFDILIKTVKNGSDDQLFYDNLFYIEGDGNIKYTHNNGILAKDPKLATSSFLRTIDKIPELINSHKVKAETTKKEIPILEQIVNSSWKKEDELKLLKAELTALERKIELSLKPVTELALTESNDENTLSDYEIEEATMVKGIGISM